MRKKSKQDPNLPGAVEMVIKINNENVVIEVIPPVQDFKGDEVHEVHEGNEVNEVNEMNEVNEVNEVDEVAEAGSDETEILQEMAETSPAHCEDSNMSCSSDPLSLAMEDRKTTHNKSEKLRRAQLKASMEKLKLLVPLEDSTQKYTTAALLRKARYLIQKLEERERKNTVFKEQLQREQRYLRKRLEQMQQLPREGLLPLNPSLTTTPTSQMQSRIKLPTAQSVSSTKPKYPLPLSTSQGQLKTPPILKRKQNLEPENTEIFYINTSNPGEVKSTIDLGMSPTYELIATADNYGFNSNNISENYCIIIDAGMVQEGFPVSIV